jgi:hypothetical protein
VPGASDSSLRFAEPMLSLLKDCELHAVQAVLPINSEKKKKFLYVRATIFKFVTPQTWI